MGLPGTNNANDTMLDEIGKDNNTSRVLIHKVSLSSPIYNHQIVA